MGTKARGRGVAATFGLLILLAGIAGAVVLWVMAERRPEQAVDGFARGSVGCTTTLEFKDTGTFYVYEERVGGEIDAVAACRPVPTPGAEFSVELLDDGRPLALRDDGSITYDTESAIGESVARIEIDEAGRYDLVVVGDDPQVVAAVGRDPTSGVSEYRRRAVVVGVVGAVLGSLLLLLAGRRSKRAATYGPPGGPGLQPPIVVPAEPPVVVQRPVDPMLPPGPVEAQPAAGTEPAPTAGDAEERRVWPPAPPRVEQPASDAPGWPPEPPRVAPPVSDVAGSETAASPSPSEPPRAGVPAVPSASPRAEQPVESEPVESEPAVSETTEPQTPPWPPEPPRLDRSVPVGADQEDASDGGPPASSPWAPPQPGERRDPPPPA